eukprot:3760344-Rhodomonas_salina.4
MFQKGLWESRHEKTSQEVSQATRSVKAGGGERGERGAMAKKPDYGVMLFGNVKLLDKHPRTKQELPRKVGSGFPQTLSPMF